MYSHEASTLVLCYLGNALLVHPSVAAQYGVLKQSKIFVPPARPDMG